MLLFPYKPEFYKVIQTNNNKEVNKDNFRLSYYLDLIFRFMKTILLIILSQLLSAF